MAKAEDCGDYYRVPLDGRSLNYAHVRRAGRPRRIDEHRRLHQPQHHAAHCRAGARSLTGFRRCRRCWRGPAVTCTPRGGSTHRRHRPRRASSPGTCAAPPGRGGAGTCHRAGRPSSPIPTLLDAALAAADAVIHLAGVNRAKDDAEIAEVNPWLAEQLVEPPSNGPGSASPSSTATRSTRWVTRCSGWPSAGRPRSCADWGARSGAPVVDVVHAQHLR